MEPIYTVLSIILVIWIGIFGYMMHLDKEVKRLNEKVKKFEDTNKIEN